MADRTYNGWVNYETWCVFTWLSNEETLYRLPKHLAMGEGSNHDKTERLKAWVIEGNPLEESASLYSDLLQRAFGAVRWDKIITEAKEE